MALCLFSPGLPGKGSCGEGGRALRVPAAGLSTAEQEGKQPGRLGGEGQPAFGNWRAVGGEGISKSLPPPASLKDNRSLEHRVLLFCFHGSDSPSASTGCPGAASPAPLEPQSVPSWPRAPDPRAAVALPGSPESCHSKQHLGLGRPFPKDHFQRLGKHKENKSTMVFQN